MYVSFAKKVETIAFRAQDTQCTCTNYLHVCVYCIIVSDNVVKEAENLSLEISFTVTELFRTQLVNQLK